MDLILKFLLKALELSHKKCTDIRIREHVTSYIRTNKRKKHSHPNFKVHNIKNDIDFSYLRLTMNDIQDFKFINNIIANNGFQSSWQQAVSFLLENQNYLKKIYIKKNRLH